MWVCVSFYLKNMNCLLELNMRMSRSTSPHRIPMISSAVSSCPMGTCCAQVTTVWHLYTFFPCPWVSIVQFNRNAQFKDANSIVCSDLKSSNSFSCLIFIFSLYRRNECLDNLNVWVFWVVRRRSPFLISAFLCYICVICVCVCVCVSSVFVYINWPIFHVNFWSFAKFCENILCRARCVISMTTSAKQNSSQIFSLWFHAENKQS